MSFDEIRVLVERGTVDEVVGRVLELEEDQRRSIAKLLPAYFRAADWRDGLADIDWLRLTAQRLLVVGAGCMGAPSAAAAWLARSEVSLWGSPPEPVASAIFDAMAHRGPHWRSDVAHRLAGKLRGSRPRAQVEARIWNVVVEIVARDGIAPPRDDGFVLLCVRSAPMVLIDHRFRGLVPLLFEVDRVGAEMRAWSAEEFADCLLAQTVSGGLDRADLLDGAVRTMLRGGTPADLRWALVLHERLDPTIAEIGRYRREYLRLLATASPAAVAAIFRRLRLLHDQSPLSGDDIADATGVLLFRSERALIGSTLDWLAGMDDHTDLVVTAACRAFGQQSLDIREQAVDIAVRRADQVSPQAADTVRTALGDLGGEHAARIAAAYGAPAPRQVVIIEPTIVPVDPVGPCGPIESLDELIEVLTSATPGRVEDALAAIVTMSGYDRDGVDAALRRAFPQPERARREADTSRAVIDALLWTQAHTRIRDNHPVQATPERLFDGRIREIARAVRGAHVPLLLATPTEPSGLLDPEVLLSRLKRYRQVDAVPGPLDLDQALWRLPLGAARASEIVHLARELGGQVDRIIAARLTGPDPLEPTITCRPFTPDRVPVRHVGRVGSFHTSEEGVGPTILATVSLSDTVVPSGAMWEEMTGRDTAQLRIDDLLRFPGAGGLELGRAVTYIDLWPAMTPSDPDVIAAHLLAAVTGTGHGAHWIPVVGQLALSGRPPGTVTATLIAKAMGGASMPHRDAAAELVTSLTARDRLPAAKVGIAIGQLVQTNDLKLNRVAAVLAEVSRGGPIAAIWPVFAAALPGLLDTRRSGLADLLDLATRAATAAKTRDLVPGLVEAATSRSTEIARAARRLQTALVGLPST